MKKLMVGQKVKFKDIHPSMHPYLLINSKATFIINEIRDSPVPTKEGYLVREYLFSKEGTQDYNWISEARLQLFEDLIQVIS